MEIEEQLIPDDRILPTAAEMQVIGKKVAELRRELQQTEWLRGKDARMPLANREKGILRERLLIHIRIHILDGFAEGKRLTSRDVSDFLWDKHRDNMSLVQNAEVEKVIGELAPLFRLPASEF